MLKAVLFYLLIVLFIPLASQATYLDLSRDANGWTVFTPSDDSRICYVDPTGGDNGTAQYYDDGDAEVSGANSPTNPGSVNAYETYAGAYADTRDGYPDWILIKRGETITGTINTSLRNGRDSNEPFVVGAYGSSGLSPLFKVGTSNGLSYSDKTWLAVFGLNFYAHTRDPDGSDYTGTSGGEGFTISNLSAGNDSDGMLIEGCKFRFFTWGISAEARSSGTITGLEVRRCVIYGTYAATSGNDSTGFYNFGGTAKVVESVFDHNGWYHAAGGSIGVATDRNHNTYFNITDNSVLQGNIFLRPGSIGNKFRSDDTGGLDTLTVDNNFYYDCEVALSMGGNTSDASRFVDITVTDNVISDCGKSQQTGRTLGWGLNIQDWNGGTVYRNILMHQTNNSVTGAYGIDINGTCTNVDISNNVIHNLYSAEGLDIASGSTYSGMTFTDNKIINDNSSEYTVDANQDPSGDWTFSSNTYYSDKTAGTRFLIVTTDKTMAQWNTDTGDTGTFEDYAFPDDTRTILTYMTSISETSTESAFIAACRAQDRFDWDTNFMADSVNDYIRSGFGMGDDPVTGEGITGIGITME